MPIDYFIFLDKLRFKIVDLYLSVFKSCFLNLAGVVRVKRLSIRCAARLKIRIQLSNCDRYTKFSLRIWVKNTHIFLSFK